MRATRFLLLLVALAVFVLPFTLAGAQDAGDVTVGVKDILEDGDTVQGAFEARATAHLYAFSGSAGDLVSISMTQEPDSDLDPFLVLLGPNGEVVASDDDSGEDVEFSSLIDGVELPADGTYLIIATSYVYIDNILVEVGDETGDQELGETYTLTLSGATTPANATPPEENVISLAATGIKPGDTLQGESSAEAPVGFYALKARAGDTISITAASDDIDTVIHVFDPQGNRIAVNDDAPDGEDTNSAIRGLALDGEGTYLILATDVFFYDYASNGDPDTEDDFSGGAYTLQVE